MNKFQYASDGFMKDQVGRVRHSLVSSKLHRLTGKHLNLTKDALLTVGVPLSNIIGQCMDGASNMSGKERGLSTRIKEVAPKATYVHCYGHVLNLALQDTMSTLEPLRNALGVIQSLYNLLEASSKRHAFLEKVKGQEEDVQVVVGYQMVLQI
ncbi:Zinc finger MYM-type protein 1 [Holothuria leucospilota]|uniref:Zinc finger MYM-type protein 1 n=1 Tax=Holothuria leucospilota TaxID=206669 RepID=A0A9Q1CFR5_HOLLE|nr:Zinc finger MYM-type protein 1 [Holothuria leucospilota]